MTLEELKKGEHETVEYKQDIPAEKEKYLKTAVAFANAAGDGRGDPGRNRCIVRPDVSACTCTLSVGRTTR